MVGKRHNLRNTRTQLPKKALTRPFRGHSGPHFYRRTRRLSCGLVNPNDNEGKTTNVFYLRSWSFVMLMENSFPPLCKPESNPAGSPPDAAKYTQGFANEPCVTECGIDVLHMARVSIAERIMVGVHVREEERHDGAISCSEVGGAIHETTGGNLNLRGASADNRRDEQMESLTLMLVELLAGTVGVGVLAEAVVEVPPGVADDSVSDELEVESGVLY